MSYDTVIKIEGYWKLELYGQNGALKDKREFRNIVTTNGKEALASFLHSAATSAQTDLKYVAVGTDATAETNGDTALGVEAARVTGTPSYTSGGIYEVVGTFPAGTGTGAIVEYGLLNTATAGTLFSRATDSVINKGASDVLVATYQVTFA
jgi:hypothetical protein